MFSATSRTDMIGRPRVMVVDDERGVRESLRAILQPDYEVSLAASGEEALALLRTESFDLVTLDLRMPGMAGNTVLEHVKAIDPDIEVLIITGYGSFETAIHGLRHRAFDYLSKPFDTAKVRQVIEAALARRAAVQLLKAAPEGMLGTLSHGFRTPLNIIMGYATMLREEIAPSLSEEQRLAFDRIESNSSTLLTYVENLFYLAELDRNHVAVTSGPVRLAALLAHVRESLAPLAAAKRLPLIVEVTGDPVVVTDEDKVVRLLRVLGENALRYSESGRVVLAAAAAPTGVTIEVRDGGPGLSPIVIAEAEAVAAGRQDTPAPQFLGFGLRLVGRLARLLGAALTITSGPEGTTVRLRIPEFAVDTALAASG